MGRDTVASLDAAFQRRWEGTPEAPREFRCPGCGRRSRDKTGVCSSCRWTVPDLRRLTADQLKALAANIRDEVERRQRELAEVIK